MSTAIVRSRQDSRWYYQDGKPCYELPKKSGEGTKTPTLADARVLGLVPSVTTILKILYKPALQDWITAQSVMAVLTSTQKPGESLDQFVERVLMVERVQDQERDVAANRGKAIHEAIMDAVEGKDINADLKPYVDAAFTILNQLGKVTATEKVVVGDGYAGRLDMILENDTAIVLPDFKTTGKLPDKDSWDDHKLQTAAYAAALHNTGDKRIVTANIYLSTKSPGQSRLFVQEDWSITYVDGFQHLLRYWQWVNQYVPSKTGGAR